MKNFEKNMKAAGAGVKLTTEEKLRMKERIYEYMAHTPVRKNQIEVSRSQIFVLSHRFTAVFAIVAVLFTSGVGVSYASNNALPGEALYVLKETKEEVALYFISNDVEKAEYAITRVEKRLQEAEVLAIRGELDTKAEEIVIKKIEEQKQDAETYIAILDEKNTPEAQALRFAFAANLEERAGIFSSRDDTKNSDTRARIAYAIQGGSTQEAAEPSVATLAIAPVSEETTTFEAAEKSDSIRTSRTMMVMKSSAPESDFVNDSSADEEMMSASMVAPMTMLFEESAAPETHMNVSKEEVEALNRVLFKEIEKLKKIKSRAGVLKEVLEQAIQSQKEIQDALAHEEYVDAQLQINETLRLLYKTDALFESGTKLEGTFY